MNSFGTRRWCMTPKFSIGSKVYVIQDPGENIAISFLLKETLFTKRESFTKNNVKSVKVMFLVDETISITKWESIVECTQDNVHLVLGKKLHYI